MTTQPKETNEPSIMLEYLGSIAVIRLNQPHNRNALSRTVLEDLDTTVSRLSLGNEISALILTGVGNIFASGANINELADLNEETARGFADLGQAVFARIASTRQKTIAAINGYCAGGGLDLALACNLRCASANAVFAHPGGKLGIITGWGGTQRLPRLIGTAHALEMFTTARRLTSYEALEIGLIDGIGDPVLLCARELAG